MIGDGKGNMLIMYNPNLGFAFNLSHIKDIAYFNGRNVPINTILGSVIKPGELNVYLDRYEPTIPHLHFAVGIPPEPMDFGGMDYGMLQSIINQMNGVPGYLFDYLQANLFLDPPINDMIKDMPHNQSYPNLQWELAPTPNPALNINIDGYVSANEWPGEPILTDASGDLLFGNAMDLTELYATRDDTYLYLMLRAGSQPAGDWGLGISLDADPALGGCGSAETVLKFDSRWLDSFKVDRLVDCDIMNSTDVGLYGGNNYLFRWGDVVEVRIPLAYLSSPDKVTPTRVETYADERLNPDIMP